MTPARGNKGSAKKRVSTRSSTKAKQKAAAANNIPPQFAKVPEEAKVKQAREAGKLSITWGWNEWRILAPLVAEHIVAFGRDRLGNALYQAQHVLPVMLRRTRDSLQVSCSNKAVGGLDVLGLLEHLLRTDHPELLSPPAAVAPAAATPARTAASAPTPPATPAGAAPTGLEAFLALPVGAFLPALRTLLADAMREALLPQQEQFMDAVRAAVIEVVGAPTLATPAPSSGAALSPVIESKPATPSHSEPETGAPPPQEARQDGEGEPELPDAPGDLLELPVIQATETPARNGHTNGHANGFTRAVTDDGARDMQSQLSAAASALGIPVAKRPSILLVGLHPKKQQEVERALGLAFRFIFLRPDAFKSSNDIPASTDALLLCRKTLNGELAAAVRRYAIPVEHVANDCGSVHEVLRALFNDDEASWGNVDHTRSAALESIGAQQHVPHRRH